ncbi:MAG: hypothetical protein LBG62_06310 [Candidatus Methanoplasma sp.]|jgi:hypothetical protein|nr:hypothetical protein [Candidatus Methanoplasma sp.]
MMEFVTSRAVAFICGAVLLGAVAVPVAGYYDGREGADMGRAADAAARALDAFWDSKADSMTVRGWDLLPFPDCSVEVDGHALALVRNGAEHRSAISHHAGRAAVGYGDVVVVTRDGDGIRLEVQRSPNASDIFLSADASLRTSPWSL